MKMKAQVFVATVKEGKQLDDDEERTVCDRGGVMSDECSTRQDNNDNDRYVARHGACDETREQIYNRTEDASAGGEGEKGGI